MGEDAYLDCRTSVKNAFMGRRRNIMIKITADSTCDIGEYAESRQIGLLPLNVILGTDCFSDGVDITPQNIFEFVERTDTLPKTSAPNVGTYEEYFNRFVSAGDTVIHINISSKSSSSCGNAKEAAKKFGDKVFVIDSRALSGGQGLLVMKAADFRDEGMGAPEIVDRLNALAPKINTSFVPDRLDYLYKGGRCSRMQMFGANLLKIHPLIQMEDGQLIAGKKYRGSMEKCISNYIDDLAVMYPNYDDSRCFITHSSADKELVEVAKRKAEEKFSFRQTIETVAGSIITSHCGRNTLGLLFIAE